MFKKMFSSIIIVLMLFSFVSAASAHTSTIYCPSYATSDYCYIESLVYKNQTINGNAIIADNTDRTVPLGSNDFDLYQFKQFESFTFHEVAPIEGLVITSGKYNNKRYNTITISVPDNLTCSVKLRFEFDGRGEFTVTIPNFVANNTNAEYCLDHEWKACKRDRVFIDSHYGYYGTAHVYDNYKDSVLHRD